MVDAREHVRRHHGRGTAGHVLPALAIAEALVDAGRAPEEIHYVGAQRGIETTLLPRDAVPAHVPRRRRACSASSTSANVRRNAAMLPKLAAAARQARALLRRLQPQVVVSVGGYASLPAVFAARRVGRADRRRQLRPPPRSGVAADGTDRGRVGGRLPRLAAAARGRHRRAGAPLDPRRRPSSATGTPPAPRSTCRPTASSSPSPAARRARGPSTRPSPTSSRERAGDASLAVLPGRRRPVPRRRRAVTRRRMASSTASSGSSTASSSSTPPPTC